MVARLHLPLIPALFSCLVHRHDAVAFSNAPTLTASAANSLDLNNFSNRKDVKSRVAALLFVAPLRSSSGEDTEEETPPPASNPRIRTNQHNLSRRRWCSTASMSTLAAAASFTPSALAAPPLTAEVADNFSARLERSLRPKPAKILRPRMNLDFAVLLMRSSYNALDEIDVVAMDQFQRDFFLIRQAEYKPYVDRYFGGTGVQQGDLSDPNYFDFISFAQYVTIAREIVDAPVMFEEKQPVEVDEGELAKFKTVIIKRDPALTKDDLVCQHTELVGNAILEKLMENFGKTASAIPMIEAGSRWDANTVLVSIKQMVNLFLINGFAWDGSASILGNNAFSIVLTSPATLWSGQSLKAMNKSVLINDFALKTIRAIMLRAGYKVANASVKYSNNQEITTFTVI